MHRDYVSSFFCMLGMSLYPVFLLIPDNRSDGMKPVLNEGFSEKSCLLLLENSKGNQGNRTKNYYSGSPLFFHENFANQPSYYHFGLLAVVTQYIKV